MWTETQVCASVGRRRWRGRPGDGASEFGFQLAGHGEARQYQLLPHLAQKVAVEGLKLKILSEAGGMDLTTASAGLGFVAAAGSEGG